MSRETWVFIVTLAAIYVLFDRLTPYDDTDDKENNGRSGMVLFTDHGTGCQYVGTGQIWGNSSITPRMDSSGNQVCTTRTEGSK